MMDTVHYTNYHVWVYTMSVLVWFIFIILYSEIKPGKMPGADMSDNMYASARYLGTSAIFYLTCPVTVAVCLLPTMIHQGWQVVMTPNLGAEKYAVDKEGFMKYVPGFMLPSRKDDVSVMYHLRHYMNYPVSAPPRTACSPLTRAYFASPLQGMEHSEAGLRLSAVLNDKDETATGPGSLARTNSSIRNDKWNLNDHAAGFHEGDSVLDVHLGHKHVHAGELTLASASAEAPSGGKPSSIFT